MLDAAHGFFVNKGLLLKTTGRVEANDFVDSVPPRADAPWDEASGTMRGMRQFRLLLVVAAATAATLHAQGPPARFDVLIRNGRIVDGTGAPWYRGDVAITGDRIAAVGPPPGPAA